MRSYVIPANPNTFKQQAHRNCMTELVKRYQSISADADVKDEWNVEGLEQVISGFNVFVQYGRKSKISASPASGSAPLDVTLTYTCGIPLAKATLIQDKAGTITIILDTGEVESGADKTKLIEDLAAGTYYWYLADDDVLKTGDESPKIYQGVTKWKPNTTTGVADECKCVVS